MNKKKKKYNSGMAEKEIKNGYYDKTKNTTDLKRNQMTTMDQGRQAPY